MELSLARVANSSNDYRYERKFSVSGLSKFEVELLVKLHPAMFSEIYYQRYINNIYFDAPNMRHYFDNIHGLNNRMKIRIRWYGDLFGVIENPKLELKNKKGLLGKKESFPLAPFSINASIQRKTIEEIFRGSEIPDALKLELICLQPTLLNRYCRKYFQSADRNYRITIDSDMEFYLINCQNNTFLQKSADSENTIVELKYDPDKDQNVGRITNYFLFRMTKSSKYVNGIERLHMW